jgi:leucyl/phenylalanyl-tRNA--protein transferase
MSLYNEYGIVAVGGPLTSEHILTAYENGIFPWPIEVSGIEESVLAWFCPEPRAILHFDDLHIPKSLNKWLKKNKDSYSITFDQSFNQVIEHCLNKTGLQDAGSTWITPEMLRAYKKLNLEGHAHSVEVWCNQKQTLVGGLYGMAVHGCFAGESMFHYETNASKLALIALIDFLKKKGATWIDIQVMTPHLQGLGATEIPRQQFLNLLRLTQKRKLQLF